MKVVGRIISNIKDGNEIDTTYTNGVIVHLTEKEANILSGLQDAWRGSTFYNIRGKPSEMEMDNAFDAIRIFIEAKLSVNILKDTVEMLEKVVGNNELYP